MTSARKIKLQALGTDTELFRPALDAAEVGRRHAMRKERGYTDEEIMRVYTGRFSKNKNSLVLAKAIAGLSAERSDFHGLFVDDGTAATPLSFHS